MSVARQAAAQDSTAASVSVTFVYDDVFQQDDDLIQLLGGTRWRLLSSALVLPASKIVIILNKQGTGGTAFLRRTRVPVVRVSGTPLVRSGVLTQVVRAIGRGAVLQTADGALWEVPEYDQYDTGFWLPPYEVLFYGNDLYMFNLRELRRVWVTRSR